jgi:tRNA 2-thiouridine synthesizing protein A
MSENTITIKLRSLNCPLPALRTRRTLSGLRPGVVLIVSCTDPLAGIDIPHLIRQTGDTLESTSTDDAVITFRIRKR